MSESEYFYGTKHNERMERLYKEAEMELLNTKRREQETLKSIQETLKSIQAENARLKELNKEMVATLYRIIDLSWYGEPSWSDGYVRECCTDMIAKAGGEGE